MCVAVESGMDSTLQRRGESPPAMDFTNGEARLGPPIIMCTRPYPDCSVEQGECCDMDSTNESGVGSDTSDGGRSNEKEEGLGGLFNNSGQLIGSASASVFSGEEQFEDYGEGEDVDYTPSSPCPDDDARTNGFSDLGSSLPSRLVAHRGNSHSVQDIHQ
uniref:rab11 family-interacting protein 4A-like n=1 Tax=Oncorhynchus gorbuscha TaxID=8017 RepID=UPI001EAEB2B5|nr:rab11 family-interacting protein 4A-like [Oncorhynchus gorbuscha]